MADTPTYATYTTTVTLKDGSTATHTAEALRYWHDADGVIVVEAACCGLTAASETCSGCQGPSCPRCGGKGYVRKEDTRSRHTFYDPGRVTAAGQTDPAAEVHAHVQRVAEHHAAVHRAKSFILDDLMKPAASGESEAKWALQPNSPTLQSSVPFTAAQIAQPQNGMDRAPLQACLQ